MRLKTKLAGACPQSAAGSAPVSSWLPSALCLNVVPRAREKAEKVAVAPACSSGQHAKTPCHERFHNPSLLRDTPCIPTSMYIIKVCILTESGVR